MPPRNLGNRNPGSERLGDDPPLLLHRPAPAASYPGANVHPPARELRVAYSVAHMCETFPPNQQEDCNIPRASIKVGWENRLLSTNVTAILINKAEQKPIRLADFENRISTVGCSSLASDEQILDYMCNALMAHNPNMTPYEQMFL